MIRRLLSAAALLLILASRAQAAPINLLLTVDMSAPTFGPPEINLRFNFFESASNGWPGPFPIDSILTSGFATLLPGVTQFNVPLDAESLDNVYFTASGTYFGGPASDFLSFYVADPPTGPASAFQVATWGPAWISLANLDGGLSGDFREKIGFSRGPIGTWALAAAPTPITPVPEPASLLLLGSALAAVAAKNAVTRKGVD
jgi:hypothetical protein